MFFRKNVMLWKLTLRTESVPCASFLWLWPVRLMVSKFHTGIHAHKGQEKEPLHVINNNVAF